MDWFIRHRVAGKSSVEVDNYVKNFARTLAGWGGIPAHIQLKGSNPEQRVVVWTDFRRKENGKWVYVFRHAHWPLGANPSLTAPAKSPTG